MVIPAFMAGVAGLEPANTRVKVLCLNRLGDTPIGHCSYIIPYPMRNYKRKTKISVRKMIRRNSFLKLTEMRDDYSGFCIGKAFQTFVIGQEGRVVDIGMEAVLD